MLKRRAIFETVRVGRLPYPYTLIRDVGHATQNPTITNDVERLVEELCSSGFLEPRERLFYIDSSDDVSEIVIENGRFKHFSPNLPPEDPAL